VLHERVASIVVEEEIVLVAVMAVVDSAVAASSPEVATSAMSTGGYLFNYS
jgi:hypothetical protein